MNNKKKQISELTNLLKWQIDIGANAMVEKKQNIHLIKQEKSFYNKNLKDLPRETNHENENYYGKFNKEKNKDYLDVIKN